MHRWCIPTSTRRCIPISTHRVPVQQCWLVDGGLTPRVIVSPGKKVDVDNTFHHLGAIPGGLMLPDASRGLSAKDPHALLIRIMRIGLVRRSSVSDRPSWRDLHLRHTCLRPFKLEDIRTRVDPVWIFPVEWRKVGNSIGHGDRRQDGRGRRVCRVNFAVCILPSEPSRRLAEEVMRRSR